MKIDKEQFMNVVGSGLLQYRQNVQQQRAQTGSPLEYIRLNAIDATVEAIQDYLNQVMNEIQKPEEPAPEPVKEEPESGEEEDPQPDPDKGVPAPAKKTEPDDVLEKLIDEATSSAAMDITEAQKALEPEDDGE